MRKERPGETNKAITLYVPKGESIISRQIDASNILSQKDPAAVLLQNHALNEPIQSGFRVHLNESAWQQVVSRYSAKGHSDTTTDKEVVTTKLLIDEIIEKIDGWNNGFIPSVAIFDPIEGQNSKSRRHNIDLSQTHKIDISFTTIVPSTEKIKELMQSLL